MKYPFFRILRRLAAGVALLAGLPAFATTFSTDFTDIWWNPSESGWGLNIIQEGEVLFATLFVYGADNSARWFVASNLSPATVGNQSTFSGTLYQPTGPFFGGATFNAASVNLAPVGSMSVSFTDASHAALQYIVNGTTVSKSIQRQTWRTESFSGNYVGGLTAIGSNCSGGVANGAILTSGFMGVRQNDTQATFTVAFNNPQGAASQCVFSGSYQQNGHMGTVSGNWSCATGNTITNRGTFTLSTLQVNQNGFTGKFTGNDQFCSYNGQFGGVKDVL